jgi:MFS family permease
VPHDEVRPSYRALLGVPQLGRVVASMQLARIAQSMLGVAIVLFTLAEYDSPALTGIVTFASIFPGLLIAPVAGALLDRHGRVRLMGLDYVVAALALLLIAALAATGALTPPLLVVIAVVTSLTAVLSIVGLRTILPIMVPAPLWERVNAVDSAGYVVATILGPPLAAILVAIAGPRIAIAAIAIPFGLAVLALVGVREPKTASASTGRLLIDAWDGMRYVWRNPTLRGLGFSVSMLGIGMGGLTIVVPLIVLESLGYGEAAVGLVWAASGASGILAAFLFGRLDTRGREQRLVAGTIGLMAPAFLLLVPAAGVAGFAVAPAVGLGLVFAALFLYGCFDGPFGIAMFTLRQRRTDPAWLGRAFAVSMAFNFMGFPIGAAIAGVLASVSLGAALTLTVVAPLVAAVSTLLLVPRRDAEPGMAAADRGLVEAALSEPPPPTPT